MNKAAMNKAAINKPSPLAAGKASGRTAGRADPRRNEIAAVAAEIFADAAWPGPVLAAGVEPAVRRALPADAAVWSRFAGSGAQATGTTGAQQAAGTTGAQATGGISAQATEWPNDGAYGAGIVRLPGGWDAFRMTLHAVCARLPAGAPLWVYGGAEEGIASLDKRLDGLAEGVETVALKKRTRVLQMTRTAAAAQGALKDWRESHDIAVPNGAAPLSLAFYPGCFAAGRLDDGTKLLLENLPSFGPAAQTTTARTLDFASGTGVVAAALRARAPNLRLTLLDADATALAAARENVPDAAYVLSDGLSGLEPAARFDLIVSNPPIHTGRQEDFSVLSALLEQAPKLLRPKGALIFVVQRTAGIGRLLAGLKRKNVKLAETSAFQVWRVE